MIDRPATCRDMSRNRFSRSRWMRCASSRVTGSNRTVSPGVAWASFEISAGGTLTTSGRRGIAVVNVGVLRIDGVLDANARDGVTSPGGYQGGSAGADGLASSLTNGGGIAAIPESGAPRKK